MTKALWFSYVVLTTGFLVFLLDKLIRARTSKMNTFRKAFIPFPALCLLGSMVTYVIFNSQTPYEDKDPIGNALLLSGLLSIIILPIIVASPMKSFWRHIPAVWGLYVTWLIFVFFPHMLLCGVPLQD